jgi:hypothetical protein
MRFDDPDHLCDLCTNCCRFLSYWSAIFKKASLPPLNKHDDGAIRLRVPPSRRAPCWLCASLHLTAKCIATKHRWKELPEVVTASPTEKSIILDGSDYALFQNDDTRPSLEADPESVSWEMIRGWLSKCDSHQHPNCRHSFTSTHNRRRLQSLKLWVIDVTQSCLVSIPSEGEYVALSYVWGGCTNQPRLRKGNLNDLQKPGVFDKDGACAKTIKDAMQVCRQLGIRYLWVDALCIIQGSKQMAIHIKNMDIIYASAYFTIVAADGTNAEHGIHGVSLPRRSKYPTDVDNIWWEFGIHSVRSWLEKSIWARRAWTLQEATMSRRLLVFTTELCCLICPKKTYREDDNPEPPLGLDQSSSTMLLQYIPSFATSSQVPIDSFKDWEDNFDSYQSWVIKELRSGNHETMAYSPVKRYSIYLLSYLSRGFSESGDILEAFSGITQMLELHMGDFWNGLPRLHLLEALSWHYDEVPLPTGEIHRSGLRDYPLSRRDGYPSYNWAGWMHCPNARVILPSCAFEEDRLTATRVESEMVAVYVREPDQISGIFGGFQNYCSTTLIPDCSTADISWIGSIQPFLLLLIGVVAGIALDARYYSPIFVLGALLEVFGTMMTSFSSTCYQLFLSQGIYVGIGSGIIFTCGVLIVGTCLSTRTYSLTRLNRSHSTKAALFDSELTEAEEENAHLRMSALNNPQNTLLVFNTIVLQVEVSRHQISRKEDEHKMTQTWASFSIADDDDQLKMRCGNITTVHLSIDWRASQDRKLTFVVLGMFRNVEYASVRMMALVVRSENGVYYREGLAQINTNMPYEEYVEHLASTGSRELVVLG